jgi:hypothetical protein
MTGLFQAQQDIETIPICMRIMYDRRPELKVRDLGQPLQARYGGRQVGGEAAKLDRLAGEIEAEQPGGIGQRLRDLM